MNGSNADPSANTSAWLGDFKQMWRELPVRQKFHGFCLILAGMIALTTVLRTSDLLPVSLAIGLFALLLLPVIGEAFLLMGDRRFAAVSAADGKDLKSLCMKIQDLERKTSLLLKLYGPRHLVKEFPRLFPYDGDKAGGVVSRFAVLDEDNAEKLLLQMHDIIRQFAT